MGDGIARRRRGFEHLGGDTGGAYGRFVLSALSNDRDTTYTTTRYSIEQELGIKMPRGGMKVG